MEVLCKTTAKVSEIFSLRCSQTTAATDPNAKINCEEEVFLNLSERGPSYFYILFLFFSFSFIILFWAGRVLSDS